MTTTTALPPQWAAAYERDHRQAPDAADPGPERSAARLLAAFILAGLVFLALPGTFMGVWNLVEISAHRALAGASTAWIQAHGQAQVFGWVGSFILGISLYILPKMRRARLRSMALAWATWALWTVGVGWRWAAGVGAANWRMGLWIAPVLMMIAWAGSQYLLIFPQHGHREKFPSDLGSLLGIVGFAGLGAALVVNWIAAWQLALHGSAPAYPPRLDRIVVELALWGFMLPLAWGYSTRFVTVFLGLQPPRQHAAAALSAGVTALIVVLLAGQFWTADLLAVILVIAAIWTLRVYEPAAKPAKRQGVYRHYPAFIRASYGWLLAGALIGVAADAWPAHPGLGGAGRHALTVGFIATLIFALGPRILPSFLSSRELFSSRLMAASLWLLNVGCLLRVISEIAAYGAATGWAWRFLPVSAFLELAGVLAFVVNIALTAAQAPRAWFRPETMGVNVPLYWYVTSYPGTRRLLIAEGMGTLAKVRDVPRSLTLAEAAAADGLDAEAVLARLHDFFRQRQPRRAGA
ncbi:MAG TPA: hypothetical protein VE996_06590 [Terriglobales bacterium]|nr:hypothetical protein [Terriglobales bacterium]